MDGGAWLAAVHEVAKSQTRLSNFTLTFHFYALEKEMATHSSGLAWRIPGTGDPGGLPFPSPGDLSNPGIEPGSPVLQPDSLPSKPSAAAAAKSLHSCPTLCDPIDGSPPGSPVPGILQARTLEWVAMSFSNA